MESGGESNNGKDGGWTVVEVSQMRDGGNVEVGLVSSERSWDKELHESNKSGVVRMFWRNLSII